ncbi:MAG: sugar phosphate isomerase/epimerase family protein [Chitinophagaceae bacterium]
MSTRMRQLLLLLITVLSFSLLLAQEPSWKLGVQMWTYHKSPFDKALERADSAGLKRMEIYPGQRIADNSNEGIGPGLSEERIVFMQDLIRKHGVTLTSFGVVVCEKSTEWEPYFQFAEKMNIPLLTAEPNKEHLDLVNELAGKYKIKVAIHNHPQPSLYWHPDSVLVAVKNRPNLGACADIGHWVREGLRPAECLQKLEGHVFSLHVKDVDGKTKEDIRFGEGLSDIPAVLRELHRQKFRGVFAIEHETNWYDNRADLIYNQQYFYKHIPKN